MRKVAIVYHSGHGHTKVLAEAVAEGVRRAPEVEAMILSVDEPVPWGELAAADAIVFGCPTYMGGVSAQMKAFMDASSHEAWATRVWRDKLAAGFTNSSAMSGDKLNTLVQLTIFAAQHDMVWVGLGLMPGNNTSRGSEEDLNRLGSHLGAMAQSAADLGPEEAPPRSDRRTAAALGERVARATLRWTGAATEASEGARHPTTSHWVFPPDERPALPAPLRRVNLRELMARPLRFEHHLTVVGSVGCGQIEAVVASEPLYFAHQNFSDEYAMSLRTGDTQMEAVPFLTLLSCPTTGEDVGRIKHRIGDVVVHPEGLLHWPGRLRPPYETFTFGPGMRRTGLSLVFCAAEPTAAHPERPLFVSEGREGATKSYGDAEVPFLLAGLHDEGPRVLGRMGDTTMRLVVRPESLELPLGGYVLVLEASSEGYFPGDLVYAPQGSVVPVEGLARALVFTAEGVAPLPPPAVWDEVPRAPFPPFEDGPRGALPIEIGGMRLSAGVGDDVTVELGGQRAEVPRYWLARFVFRVALHGYALGYVETYGGFFYDDRDGQRRLGLRGAGSVAIGERELAATFERLYRAVAADGHVERIA